MEKKFKYLDNFDKFYDSYKNDLEINEKSLFKKNKDKKKSGASQYQNVIDFLEGDSEEAKKIKKLYEDEIKGKSNSELKKDKRALKAMQIISQIGAKWAKENKMAQTKDFSFKQIRTVLEGDFDRKFSGGTNVTVGESKKND